MILRFSGTRHSTPALAEKKIIVQTTRQGNGKLLSFVHGNTRVPTSYSWTNHPKRYRELGQHFVQQSLNMRLIGLIMVLIGVGAFLVSPSQGGIKWFLMALGIYQSLSGFALIFFPNALASKTERMFSGSMKLWIGRAIAKCTIGLALVAWGAMNVIK